MKHRKINVDSPPHDSCPPPLTRSGIGQSIGGRDNYGDGSSLSLSPSSFIVAAAKNTRKRDQYVMAQALSITSAEPGLL